jgi:hypothetical protein
MRFVAHSASFPTSIKDVLTQLVPSKKHGEAVLHTTVESQSDRDYASGGTHSHGVGDGLLLINQQSPYLTDIPHPPRDFYEYLTS